MKKLVSRVIGCALVLSIVATYFCGCNLFKSNRTRIEETLDSYWQYLLDKNMEGQDSLVEGNGYAFTVDNLTEDYCERQVIETILSKSSVRVSTCGIAQNVASVTFDFSSCDYISFEGRIKFDDLMEGLNSTSDTYSEQLVIDMRKVDGKWLINPDSVETIKAFLKTIPSLYEFYGIPEEIATDFVETLFAGFQNGNYEGASGYTALKGVIESYGEEYRDTITDSYMTILSSFFGTASDISFEVIGNYDDQVDVLVECDIVDQEAAWNAFYEDEDAFVNLITESYRYIYGAEGYDIGTYISTYADSVRSCFENCHEKTRFSVVFPVTYDNENELQVYLDDMFVSDAGFFMSTDNSQYLELRTVALDTLLEEGTIDQRQYNEAFGVTYGSNYDGVDFSYTESDEVYSCSYSIVEDSMIRINLITWNYYDEGTTFRYEIYKDDELISEDLSYVILKDHSDEIYPEYILEEQEDSSLIGNYRFVVYNEDGSELITVTLNIREESNEIEVPDIPQTTETGPSKTFEGDEINDIYYVHFENLINDQPDSFHEGDDGFDIYVSTWNYYNEGDCFIYAVYLDGELIGSERRAYVDGREGLDVIELTYSGENSDGLQVGDYTIVLYNINSSDVLMTAYLSVT